jgi:RNA polymerase sigma-70 factor (ECF subfamily)
MRAFHPSTLLGVTLDVPQGDPEDYSLDWLGTVSQVEPSKGQPVLSCDYPCSEALPLVERQLPHRLLSSIVDPELIARVARGDEGAFEQLCDLSGAVLYTLALRILQDPDETAEVLQEVYLEAWRTAGQYQPARGSPLAWLITLARSRAIDRKRAQVSRGLGRTDSLSQTDEITLPVNAPSPFESVMERELRGVVAKAFDSLPNAQQDVVKLAYYEGLSHAEIASRLNEPLGTVKTRLRLGLEKLRSYLRPFGYGE